MIERYFGDNYIEKFTLGGSILLIGATILLTVSTRKTTDIQYRVFQIEGTIVDTDTREIDFEFNDGEEDTPVGVYYYEIKYISSLGEKQVVDEGDYIVLQSITE